MSYVDVGEFERECNASCIKRITKDVHLCIANVREKWKESRVIGVLRAEYSAYQEVIRELPLLLSLFFLVYFHFFFFFLASVYTFYIHSLFHSFFLCFHSISFSYESVFLFVEHSFYFLFVVGVDSHAVLQFELPWKLNYHERKRYCFSPCVIDSCEVPFFLSLSLIYN